MGMYPLIEDANNALFDNLVAQGMSPEDATQYVIDTVDRALAKAAASEVEAENGQTGGS